MVEVPPISSRRRRLGSTNIDQPVKCCHACAVHATLTEVNNTSLHTNAALALHAWKSCLAGLTRSEVLRVVIMAALTLFGDVDKTLETMEYVCLNDSWCK